MRFRIYLIRDAWALVWLRNAVCRLRNSSSINQFHVPNHLLLSHRRIFSRISLTSGLLHRNWRIKIPLSIVWSWNGRSAVCWSSGYLVATYGRICSNLQKRSSVSSHPVQHRFGLVHSKLRNSLSPAAVEKLVYIKTNNVQFTNQNHICDVDNEYNEDDGSVQVLDKEGRDNEEDNAAAIDWHDSYW